MKTKKSFLILLTVLATKASYAIDLTAVLKLHYENNQQFENNKVTFINNLEAFPQALGGFLPNISGELDLSSSKTKRVNSEGDTPNTNTIKRSITLTQPVFNGGGNIADLKAAQNTLKARRAEYYSEEQKLLLQIIQNYVKCYIAQEQYKILETSVKYNQKQLEIAEERLKVGEATQSDVAAARANLAKAETSRLSVYADWQGQIAKLFTPIGYPPEELNSPILPKNLPKSLEDLTQKSSKFNHDINQLRYSIGSAKAQEYSAKSALLPQVNLQVSASKSYYDADSKRRSRDIFGNQSLNNNLDVSTTLATKIPIYSKGLEYSKVRQAKNATRQAVLKLDTSFKDNNANCISAWQNFASSRAAIDSATLAVKAAQIAYDSTDQELLVGTKTILDLLQAEQNLSDIKITKVQQENSYIFNAYQIKSLLGELTAQSLQLPVKYFDPEREMQKAKIKIIGF